MRLEKMHHLLEAPIHKLSNLPHVAFSVRHYLFTNNFAVTLTLTFAQLKDLPSPIICPSSNNNKNQQKKTQNATLPIQNHWCMKQKKRKECPIPLKKRESHKKLA
jgi:hypothetical protein